MQAALPPRATGRRTRRLLTTFLLIPLCGMAARNSAQQVIFTPPPPPHFGYGQAHLPQSMLDRMARQRARLNQQKIQRESGELLQLTKQLQLMLAHANKNVLPL